MLGWMFAFIFVVFFFMKKERKSTCTIIYITWCFISWCSIYQSNPFHLMLRVHVCVIRGSAFQTLSNSTFFVGSLFSLGVVVIIVTVTVTAGAAVAFPICSLSLSFSNYSDSKHFSTCCFFAFDFTLVFFQFQAPLLKLDALSLSPHSIHWSIHFQLCWYTLYTV